MGKIDTSWVNWNNEKKLTREDAKFIFEQSEKILKDLNDTNTLIVARTTTLITIAVGFMLALIGFLFTRFTKTERIMDVQLITGILSLFYIFDLCKILVKNIQSQNYSPLGTEPKKLFVDAFFTPDIEDDKRMIRFYFDEAMVYQQRIEMNIATNEMRWYLFNRSLWRLLYTPIVILFIFITLKLLIFCVTILYA